MAAPAVEGEGLRKTYGTLRAVDGLDLTVSPGECIALLGPNGAGKITTTEILEDYRHADAGSVRVLGEDPRHAGRSWRARLGIVLQTSRDLGDLTVRDCVTHFARYFPAARDPEEVIAVTGLTEKAADRAGRLSGGQRRRLDVALGIVGRPEVLFLDEPTTGFDPAARREFWGLIETLQKDGTTTRPSAPRSTRSVGCASRSPPRSVRATTRSRRCSDEAAARRAVPARHRGGAARSRPRCCVAA
jgi:ABC-2 type transport system ATP-binding protein